MSKVYRATLKDEDHNFDVLIEVPRFEGVVETLAREYPGCEVRLIALEDRVASIIR